MARGLPFGNCFAQSLAGGDGFSAGEEGRVVWRERLRCVP
jgi:hypothetical protein